VQQQQARAPDNGPCQGQAKNPLRLQRTAMMVQGGVDAFRQGQHFFKQTDCLQGLEGFFLGDVGTALDWVR
jgi:hypothetical protein